MTTDLHALLDTETVILVDDEVQRVRVAVRNYLQKLRGDHHNRLRRGKPTSMTRFDTYLDLYERLGGDADEIRDPEDGK
jgi:Na+/phosphate symporter